MNHNQSLRLYIFVLINNYLRLRYKVQGGFKAGVKKIFLPLENKEDCEKLQKEMGEIFDENHSCEFIEHVIDVAQKALIDWDLKKHLVNRTN